MAAWFALSLMAGVVGNAPALPASTRVAGTAASASARASVVILPGARVSLSGSAESQGYRTHTATVTLEDGSRKPAKLVEFQ